MKAILALILALPLAGAVFHALFGRLVPRRLVELIACGTVIGSFLAAASGFFLSEGKAHTFTFVRWFEAGDLSASMDALYDPLAAVMALMVTFVSSLIHIYSVGYMREDEDYARYFCYLNLFVFSMLVITLADNLLFLFLGWEGVGFCSYGLIGFWFQNPANASAGRKAFLLTRIGDVAFGIAIALFYSLAGRLTISHINGVAAAFAPEIATLLGMLLLWSAMGKSAQLPLSVWLPDAMAGPTPVSALIHAATMVTAGVYLLMRLFPVVSLSPTAMLAIASAGAVTAFYAACSALAQKEIKRVLAYSTISQLGYMFLGVGAGDITGSMSFLLSHAFYKALLFLAAGYLIQALHEEHDIFRMGGYVRKRLPTLFILFLAGALCLAAFPPTSGFFSKDRLLVATLTHPGAAYKVLWAIATFTSFLTALYAFRLFFCVFTGKPEDGLEREIQPLPSLMIWVLWPLAGLALVAGVIIIPPLWGGGEQLAHYLASVPGASPHGVVSEETEWGVAIGDSLIASSAIILAFLLYGPRGLLRRHSLTGAGIAVRDFLFSGFCLDRLYHAIIARLYVAMAQILWTRVDEAGVDKGFLLSGRFFPHISLGLRLWTTGRLSTYLGMLLLGFTALICILALGFR